MPSKLARLQYNCEIEEMSRHLNGKLVTEERFNWKIYTTRGTLDFYNNEDRVKKMIRHLNTNVYVEENYIAEKDQKWLSDSITFESFSSHYLVRRLSIIADTITEEGRKIYREVKDLVNSMLD
jgi:hypothetical protein